MKELEYTVSLLTSSSSAGLAELRKEFFGEIAHVELYALREPDLLELFSFALVPDNPNLVDIIGGPQPEDMTEWASLLKGALGKNGNVPDPDALTPVSITTCIPQVVSSYRRKDAVKALKNILALASELGIRCVEMVCGRIAERCPKASGNERCSAVVMEKPEEKLKLLVESLEELKDFADGLANPVAVALEVEPGPLYVLKNLEIATQILEETSGTGWILGEGDQRRHFVGLNIDIGHMLICQEKRKDVWDMIDVKRVYNFHISDNAEMHFADLVPGTIHSIAPDDHSSFAGWLSCFLCVCDQGNPAIFTNNVSIELEGCASPQWAHQAIRNTNYLLNELKRQYGSRYTHCEGCRLAPTRH